MRDPLFSALRLLRAPLSRPAKTAPRRLFSLRPPSQAAITKEQTALVKATAPALAVHGLEITTRFYRRLFERHPELRNVFNSGHMATGTQPAALAHAVWAYADNIDRLDELRTAISRIGHKHASLGVVPEQYPVVGENLLWAVKDVLGDAATPEILDAWRAAYQQLADTFIDFERRLYEEAAATPGGWNGWRKFRVTRKVRESDEIVSFYLSPVDGGALPPFQPGQYISLRNFVPELGLFQPRQYSLSGVPGGSAFRISVKRESAVDKRPAGVFSNLLHEALPEGSEIDVSFPYGDFTLDIDATTPVVLVSGGVGLTPMMSMLGTVVEQSKTRPVVFIHAARDGKVHAMKKQLAEIMAKNKQVSRAIYYEKATNEDKKGVDYDYVGRINFADIKDKAILPGADYYFCGPSAFMNVQKEALLALGVPEKKIHMEIFGSTVA